MCGQVGIAGPGINSFDLDIVREMLIVATLRGTDSTGILQGKSTNWFDKQEVDYVIEKAASDASYFKWFHLHSKDGNKRILNSVQDNFIACHVRAATKGRVTDENAHPFEFDRLIGMHNGTLRDQKYHHETKTDSEMMIKDMDVRGIVPVLRELDPASAYAMILFDKEKGTLSFVRNDQRTLFFGVHATRHVIYWASEEWMIREICRRNTEKLLKDDIYYFEPHKLYTIHPKDIVSKQPMPFETEKFTPNKKKEVHTNVNGFGTRFQGQQQLLSGPKNFVSIPKVKDRNPGNKILFNSRTKIPTYYCCACQRKLSLVDVHYGTKLNASGTTVICEECDGDFAMIKRDQEEVIIN